LHAFVIIGHILGHILKFYNPFLKKGLIVMKFSCAIFSCHAWIFLLLLDLGGLLCYTKMLFNSQEEPCFEWRSFAVVFVSLVFIR